MVEKCINIFCFFFFFSFNRDREKRLPFLSFFFLSKDDINYYCSGSGSKIALFFLCNSFQISIKWNCVCVICVVYPFSFLRSLFIVMGVSSRYNTQWTLKKNNNKWCLFLNAEKRKEFSIHFGFIYFQEMFTSAVFFFIT